MKRIFAITALCAIVFGCGCSKEESAADGVPERMKDVAYTNKLINLRSDRAAISAEAERLRAKIAKFGKAAQMSTEYIDLTNRLAKCEAEMAALRKETVKTVRERILREKAQPNGGGFLKSNSKSGSNSAAKK